MSRAPHLVNLSQMRFSQKHNQDIFQIALCSLVYHYVKVNTENVK